MPKLRHRAAHFTLKKLGFFNRRYTELMYNKNFVVPIINGRKTYASEQWMFSVIETIFSFRAGGFVDVGVNLGQTMLKVAAADPTRNYVGFEPNPACADYAVALAAANGLPYTIVPVGLADRSTILELQIYRHEDTDPSASMISNFRDGVIGKKHICVFSADDLPPSTLPDAASIIKIDVEGGESWVISGMKNYISRTRPFIFIEIFPVSVNNKTFHLENQNHLESDLSDLDYIKFAVIYDKKGFFVGVDRVNNIGIDADLSLIDYIMAPREDADRLVESLARIGTA